jgi:predicted RNA binding protein YcfA (HicA-like mRNA interferase family)
MSRITPVSWRRLICVFEQLGYVEAGQRGSHHKLEKPGTARPLIIPEYSEIGPDIIHTLIRTASITREQYLALLENC